MNFLSGLLRKKDLVEQPNHENDRWLKQVVVMGQMEKRAKHASVVLEDGRIFVFGGQTDKKEVDNSCFIIEERAVTESISSSREIAKPSKIGFVHGNDFKRKASLMNLENNSMRYFITNPPINNPHESPPGLRSHTAVRYQDKVIVFGGKNKIFLNNTYILNTKIWYVFWHCM
jgi:N-acetylneuraminic acid mutarotase